MRNKIATKLATTEILAKGLQRVVPSRLCRTAGMRQGCQQVCLVHPAGRSVVVGNLPPHPWGFSSSSAGVWGVLRSGALWDLKLIRVSDFIVLKPPKLRLRDFPVVAELVPWIAGSCLPAPDSAHPRDWRFKAKEHVRLNARSFLQAWLLTNYLHWQKCIFRKQIMKAILL